MRLFKKKHTEPDYESIILQNYVTTFRVKLQDILDDWKYRQEQIEWKYGYRQ